METKKRILFLHGFGSSGATQTAEYLRHKLPEVEVASPDIPLNPEEALRFLNKLCHDTNPDVIVGTSMGAMYAQQMHGYHKILVNPAFHVSEIMRRNMGDNQFTNPRESGETEFKITKHLCNEYEEMERSQFDGITSYDRKHTYAFFGTEDTLVNAYEEYLKYYGNATQYPGGHNLLQKWVKAYILPSILQLLDEEPDTENISAQKTFELLLTISDGGKKGYRGYEQLLGDYSDIWCKIADKYRGDIERVMKVAREGFRKIVKNYIFDFDDISSKSFPKVLHQQLHEYFKHEERKQQFNKLAFRGTEMDEMFAMQLLTKLYIENCGISLGERTIAYDCGWEWLKKYNEKHPEEKRWNKDTPFISVMPIICEDYKEELYGEYDVCYISTEEQIADVMYSLDQYDDDTAIALCYALHRMEFLRKRFFYQLMEVRIQEFNTLNTSRRALFFDIEDAEKEMQKWTEHGRRNLLCYIIRQLPREQGTRMNLKLRSMILTTKKWKMMDLSNMFITILVISAS